MCDCVKDFHHWMRYSKLRLWRRHVLYGKQACMTPDEWQHWFNDKPALRVIREANDIIQRCGGI